VLIPRYGMNGAAFAWLVSIAVNNVAGLIEVRYLLGLTPFGAGFSLVAGASLVCFGGLGLAARVLFGVSLPVFVVFLVASTALYCGVLWRSRGILHLDMLLEGVRLRRRRMVERA
jgi:hypothetical protein